jgi:hypothetical protein
VAAIVLFVAYVGLSFLNNPHGYLGTDTGGKMATLEAMTQRGGTSVDVGYWAATDDPTGSLHPLYYTYRITSAGSTQWVNVTTVPAIELAAPLYRMGGARAVLLLPMFGAVLCALAARQLARRLGAANGTAWTAFWLVGLASPVTIYALDFWEHTLGLAAMAWGLLALLRVLDARTFRGIAGAGALGGLLFGVAATMRTEALVYALVTTAAVALAMIVRPPSSLDDVRPRPSVAEALAALVVLGATTLVALFIPLVANDLLERAILGAPLRSARATGTAAGAGASALHRLGEGMTTTFATSASIAQTVPVVLGVALAVAIAVAVRASVSSASVSASASAEDPRSAARAQRTARLSTWAAVAIVMTIVVTGPGFVPGLFAAAPVAAAGVLGGRRSNRDARLVRTIALSALPLVWVFQFTGGALPQWGGRYVLLSGFVVTVVGVVALAHASASTRRALLLLAVLVTGGGLWWTHVRTNAVAEAGASLAARHEPMLISTEAHLFREIGPVAYDRTWLTVENRSELDRAVAIAESRGIDEIGLVQIGSGAGSTTIAGWRPVATETIPLFDAAEAIHVTTYRH